MYRVRIKVGKISSHNRMFIAPLGVTLLNCAIYAFLSGHLFENKTDVNFYRSTNDLYGKT